MYHDAMVLGFSHVSLCSSSSSPRAARAEVLGFMLAAALPAAAEPGAVQAAGAALESGGGEADGAQGGG